MPLAGRGRARTRLYLEPAAKTESESERAPNFLPPPPPERSFAAQLAHRRGRAGGGQKKLKARPTFSSPIVVCLLGELLRTDVREGILFV